MALEKNVKNKTDEWWSSSRSKDERLILKIQQIRRQLWIGHIIKHDEFVVNILEGAISDKRALGRPGLQYFRYTEA
jgi:hypothetical protein